MTYTSHGHPIPGFIAIGPKPSNVARCGGPSLCSQCSRETAVYLEEFHASGGIITVLPMTNAIKLYVLRMELFGAMQQLNETDLVEFWKMIDDVNAVRKTDS